MNNHASNSRPVLLGLGLALTGIAHATFNPIPLTTGSFNQDVVVEKSATPVLRIVTTASVDTGTNNTAATWMEAGFDPANPANGLPAPGTVFTAISNANYSFQMPPDYTQPNGILINATQVTNGTFTLTTPAAYTLLSFLSSGGNGGDVIGVTVHHQDGSTESGSFGSPDWFFGTSNVAFIANERVGSTVDFTYANVNSDNPRLYFRDVPLTNTTSPVTSIDLYYLSGPVSSHNDVVAVSGATTLGGPVAPIAVTGYTYDFIVEKEAAKRGRIVSTNIVDGTNVWATTQTLENQANTSWTFYEQGYNIDNPDGNGFPPNPAALNTGLPPAGSSVTNAAGDHIYTLPADYTANNVCFLSTTITNRTLTFATPTVASVVSFLATSGGGAATIDLVVHHQDASTQAVTVVVPDWFNTTASFVFGADGRVAVDTAAFSGATLNPDGTKRPRLQNVDFLVAGSSPIVSIDVSHRETGGQVGIFAVSGTTDPVAPVIVTHPQSQKVNPGANVEFITLAIANVPISYQWQKGTNGVFANLLDGGNISGATTTNLSLTAVGDSDDAQYRCIVTNAAGSATSAVATLTVISSLTDVTIPSDPVTAYQPSGGSSPGGEPPANAINDTTTKYLNFANGVTPMSVPVGFVVVPSAGRTIVSAMRLYTADDAAARDPANVILEGSNDGGATYTLIHSNAITLPDGRNTAGFGLDPLGQNIAQVRFHNTNSYTSYRWHTTRVKGNTSIMQIGEVELLGVVDTSNPVPFFTAQPASKAAFNGSSTFFSAFASGTPAPNHRWQKGTNGVFVELADGGNISGAQTTFLSISPVGFSDAADYRCIATNTAGATTSLVARLTVVSTNTDVTQPGDLITSVGDQSAGFWANDDPANAIDDFNVTSYQNGGSGLNAPAGFPPFGGPAGVVVTPAAGGTRVVGLRIYTSTAVPARDPVDYLLEGSNDGGSSYATLSSGPLNLPNGRADNAQAFDPTVQPMQEVLFNNTNQYTSYRLTFSDIKDPNATPNVCMEIGEIELLGVVTSPAQPVLSITPDGFGGFTIQSTLSGGNVYSTTNLSGVINWTFEGVTPLSVTPSPAEPEKFYQIRP